MLRRILGLFILASLFVQHSRAAGPEPLPGTRALDVQGDLASQMVAGIDKFLLREIDKSVERRAQHWKRDLSSAANYEKSVEQNRQHPRRMIGLALSRLCSNASWRTRMPHRDVPFDPGYCRTFCCLPYGTT